MKGDVSKRAQLLLDATSRAEIAHAAAPATATDMAGPSGMRARHGTPGIALELQRADKKSLDRLVELESRYEGGTALPCLNIDPACVATGRFFNRFGQSFDPERDEGFGHFLADIRIQGGNLVPGLVRPTGDADKPYELIYGERRLRACSLAEVPFKTEIGAFTDEQVALLHARENQFREAPSVVESALQLQSWLHLLGGNETTVSRETADRVAALFGYTARYVYILRRIAEVPRHIFDAIPCTKRMSLRQATALAEAWKKDPNGVAKRLNAIVDIDKLRPKDVIAILVEDGGVPVASPKSKSIALSLRWPADAGKANALHARLQEVEKEFGVRLGLPKSAPLVR